LYPRAAFSFPVTSTTREKTLAAAQPSETTEGAAGVPASPESGAGASSVSESADFVRRAKENPDWAWEQVRASQSAKDRAEAENQKLVERLGSAKELIDTYGGDPVAEVVDKYRILRNSQELGSAIISFEETGELPKFTGSDTKVTDDDEYKSPEEQKIEALEAELNRVRGETRANTLASGQQVLQGHIESVFQEYGIVGEHAETMRKSLIDQFTEWGRLGDKGKEAIESVMGPNGKSTVQGIMLSKITPKVLQEAVNNAALRKSQGLADLSTDSPSGGASTGMEAPPESMSAIDAARWARANPNAHNSQ